jgi:hypothetical protein
MFFYSRELKESRPQLAEQVLPRSGAREGT